MSIVGKLRNLSAAMRASLQWNDEDMEAIDDAADMLEFLFGKMGWVDLVGDTPEANIRAAVQRIKESQ